MFNLIHRLKFFICKNKPIYNVRHIICTLNIEVINIKNYKISAIIDLYLNLIQSAPKLIFGGKIALKKISLKTIKSFLEIENVSIKIKQFNAIDLNGILDYMIIYQPKILINTINKTQLELHTLYTNSINYFYSVKKLAILIKTIKLYSGTIQWFNHTYTRSFLLKKINICAINLSNILNAKPGKLFISAMDKSHGKITFNGKIKLCTMAVYGFVTLKLVQLQYYQNYLHNTLYGKLKGILSCKANLQLYANKFILSSLNLIILNFKFKAFKKSVGNIHYVVIKKVMLKNGNINQEKYKMRINTLQLIHTYSVVSNLKNNRYVISHFITCTKNTQTNILKKIPLFNYIYAFKLKWQTTFAHFYIIESAISYIDKTILIKNKLHIKNVNLYVNNFSNKPNKIITIMLRATFNKHGKLIMNSRINTKLKSAKLTIYINHFPIYFVQKNIHQDLNATLSNGVLNLYGTIFINKKNLKHIQIYYQGSAKLKNLHILHQSTQTHHFYFQILNFQNINVKINNNEKLHCIINKIHMSNFYTNVIFQESRIINLNHIFISKRFKQIIYLLQNIQINVRYIMIHNHNIHFIKNSVKLNLNNYVVNIYGTIYNTGFSFFQKNFVNLYSKVNRNITINIVGILNLFFQPLFLDIQINLKNIQLQNFTTYLKKYFKFPIQSGELSLYLKYKIKFHRIYAINTIQMLNTIPEKLIKNNKIVQFLPQLLLLRTNTNHIISLNFPIAGLMSNPKILTECTSIRVFKNLLKLLIISMNFSVNKFTH